MPSLIESVPPKDTVSIIKDRQWGPTASLSSSPVSETLQSPRTDNVKNKQDRCFNRSTDTLSFSSPRPDPLVISVKSLTSSPSISTSSAVKINKDIALHQQLNRVIATQSSTERQLHNSGAQLSSKTSKDNLMSPFTFQTNHRHGDATSSFIQEKMNNNIFLTRDKDAKFSSSASQQRSGFLNRSEASRDPFFRSAPDSGTVASAPPASDNSKKKKKKKKKSTLR
eukprot:Selendium_serpulae@DN7033_c0_g1_i1.p1